MTIGELWNCPADRQPLEFTCLQKWEALQATDSPDVRHCPACRQNVHLCRTAAEFVAHGEQGHCVALPRDVHLDRLCEIRVGMPSPESVLAHRAEQERVRQWWRAVLDGKVLDKAASASVQAIVQRNQQWSETAASLGPPGMPGIL